MITITESEQMQEQDPEICHHLAVSIEYQETQQRSRQEAKSSFKKLARPNIPHSKNQETRWSQELGGALTILWRHKADEEGGGDGGGCGVVAHVQPQPLKDKYE